MNNLFLAVLAATAVSRAVVYALEWMIKSWIAYRRRAPAWLAEQAARIAEGQTQVARECADLLRERLCGSARVPWLDEAVIDYLELLSVERARAIGVAEWRRAVGAQLQILGKLVGREVAIDFAMNIKGETTDAEDDPG